MIYQLIPPHPAIKAFVKEYLILHFVFDSTPAQRPANRIEARAEQSINFYPAGPNTKVDPHSGMPIVMPQAIVQGQLLSSGSYQHPNQFKMVKIVFQPGGLFHLLGRMPTTYFSDAVTDAGSVLGSEMAQLLQQLMNTEQYEAMIQAVDAYLVAKYGRLTLRLDPIDRINHLLHLSASTGLSVDYLANQACLSVRQFERKFKERNGVGPKLFLRIARFNRAYRLKNKHSTMNWVDVAYACGYTDYQHLVKDFTQFGGLTPPALLVQETFKPQHRFNLLKMSFFDHL